MKRDLDRMDLNKAFPAMPESCHDALMKAAGSVKEEEPMKKKISAALIMGIALALAVIGTACAVFSSQVAEFFGMH